MEEIWKEIEGYEGLYKVSNKGRVMSFNDFRKRGSIPFIMKCATDKKGYLRIRLSLNDVRKSFTIHRLVAMAFIPQIEGKEIIDHINGIRTDNRVENLRWCTPKENVNFELAIETRSNAVKNRVESPFARKVNKLTLDGEFIETYNSIADAVRLNNFSKNTNSKICAVCNGHRKSVWGFKWEYNGEPILKVKRPYKPRKGGYKAILQYSIDGTFIAEYINIKDASQKLGIDHRFISNNLNGKRKDVYGFIFKYKEDIESNYVLE